MFGQTLRRLRQERGLTQQQLANFARIQPLQIRRYEADKSQPMLDVLQRLCQALDCSADELLFDQTATSQTLPEQWAAVSHLSPEAQAHISQTLTVLIGWYQQQEN